MTTPPTIMESRVPWTTRLHTSRPTSSVPIQWAAVGRGQAGLDVQELRLPAADHGREETATSTLSATRTAPIMAIRRRRRSRSHRQRARGHRSLVADPRVERQVDQVHQQVDQGVGDAMTSTTPWITG